MLRPPRPTHYGWTYYSNRRGPGWWRPTQSSVRPPQPPTQTVSQPASQLLLYCRWYRQWPYVCRPVAKKTGCCSCRPSHNVMTIMGASVYVPLSFSRSLKFPSCVFACLPPASRFTPPTCPYPNQVFRPRRALACNKTVSFWVFAMIVPSLSW
eukprot:COSAG06_NODE_25373_length_638_cov_1.372913_1_plen_153_part_00